MIRALGGAAIVSVALSVAVQAAPAVVSQELAQKVVWGMLAGFGSLVVAVIGLLAKRFIDFLDGLQKDVREALATLQLHTQDLYGAGGRNGIRGDLRAVSASTRRHDRELDMVCRELQIERVEDQ